MSEQNNRHHTHSSSVKHTPTQVDNIVIEKEEGFDVDWDSIEENVKTSQHHRRKHRHRLGNHGSGSHSSATHGSRRHGSGSHNSIGHLSEGTDKGNNISADGGTRLKHTVQINEDVKKKKKPLILKILIGLLIFMLCVAVGLSISFAFLRYNGKKELFTTENLNIETIDGAETHDKGQTVTYNGTTYRFNPYVTSILFMGVDKEEFSLEDGIRGTGGQADAIYLLAYDASNGKVRIISFSRDTLVDINQYTESGNYAGVKNTQLCLAYAYGDGKELSAENVVTSLQRVIFNIPIKSYFAMDLSAIKVLNDDIGGVKVTVLESFGQFTKGETITLVGDQAEAYVRTRDVNILDSNVGRMERQKQYITSFANQLVPAVQKDISIPLDLYNDTKDYVITNLDTSKITYLASSVATSYNGLDIVNVPGNIVENAEDGKAEFIPDSEKLYEIILDTFYTVE